MNGLMIKDIRLLLQRKTTLVVLVLIAFVMGFSTEGGFIVGYLTFLCTIYASSTIGYDEYDNGFPFIMSLPIDAKTYVLEKYVFCTLSGLLGWACSLVIVLAVGIIRQETLQLSVQMQEACMYIPLVLIIVAFMIPFPLKFGLEKGRIAMAVFGGGIFAFGILMKRMTESMHLVKPAFLEKLDQANDIKVLVGFLILGMVIYAISMVISMGIMKKKEF